MKRAMKPTALLAALALAPAAVPQDAHSAGDPRPGVLERVVVLGASLSEGYELPCNLAAAFEASLARAHGPVRSHTGLYFFHDALHEGSRQLEQALEAEPTLVVAVDFLFWFGYGSTNARGEPLASEDERLVLLEKGLDILDELECPLVVADFPDMSKTIGKMLAEAQVPAPETLVKLSQRVRAWARERGRTLVLPLAEIVQQHCAGRAVRIGRHEFPAGTELLQEDELHPTLLGLTALAQLVADELVQEKLAAEEDFTFDLDAVLATLRTEQRTKPTIGRGR